MKKRKRQNSHSIDSTRWLKCYSLVFVVLARHDSGAFHGKRVSGDSSAFKFGALVKMKRRYSYGFSPFSFAVSMILKTVALAFAPDGVLANSQFFLPMTKGLILLSARLLSISSLPSSMYLHMYGSSSIR
jgi:hypothetical protein